MRILFFSALLLTTTLFYNCNSAKQEPDSAKQQPDLAANRDLVKKYHEIWSNGRVAELDKIMSPDFVCHFIDGIEWKGISGANNSISSHRKSFPDWNEEIVDMISEGDKVVTRYKSTGTHQGLFNGVDSTGRKVSIYETSIYRIADGKIVEQWGFPDALSLDKQVEGKK
jgi:predicted ester cyclase